MKITLNCWLNDINFSIMNQLITNKWIISGCFKFSLHISFSFKRTRCLLRTAVQQLTTSDWAQSTVWQTQLMRNKGCILHSKPDFSLGRSEISPGIHCRCQFSLLAYSLTITNYSWCDWPQNGHLWPKISSKILYHKLDSQNLVVLVFDEIEIANIK